MVIQILYFIGLYAMCWHSIQTGCAKHLNDFQKLSSRLALESHARNEVLNARTHFIPLLALVGLFSSTPKIKGSGQTSLKMSSILVTILAPMLPPTQTLFGIVTQ